MNWRHLIDAARILAGDSATRQMRGRPRQAMLKRAVSTVYYAMFHALCLSNANRVPVYCAETTGKAHEEPRVSALGAIQYAVTELIQTAANPESAERMRRIAAAPYEQVLEERVVFGTPAEIVDTIKGYQEDLGVTGVVMEVNYGGQIPADRVVNSLRLMSNEVMPHFKG